MTKRPLLILLILLAVTDLSAQGVGNLRKLLVPVFTPFPITGAGGASFATELNIFSVARCTYFPADAISGHYGIGMFGPSLGSIGVEGPRRVSPRFVFFDPACYEQSKFSETVIGPGGRVQLPLVRPEQFRTGVSQLLGIPILLRGGDCHIDCSPVVSIYRHKVRVINEEDDAHGEVLVRLWLPWHAALLPADAEYRLALDQREGNDESYPYFGQVDIENPCLRQSASGCVSFVGRLEIVPVSPGLRYWAFATSTHNETQQIEVSFPQ